MALNDEKDMCNDVGGGLSQLSLKELPSHMADWPRQLPSGIRLIDPVAPPPKPEGWTRFVCFSDTHGKHDQIPAEHRPAADVLLHAGDFTNTGEFEQIESFDRWLQQYPAEHCIVICLLYTSPSPRDS